MSRPWEVGSGHRGGVTLLEMLVSLAILMLAVALSLPALQEGFGDAGSADPADAWIGMLRTASREARGSGRRVEVVLDSLGNHYWIRVDGRPPQRHDGWQHLLLSAPRTTVTFHPTGRASPASLRVDRGGWPEWIHIDGWSGRVSLAR